MCLGVALLLWLQAHAPKESVWHGMPAFVICAGLMCLILHYGPQAIKQHITYVRAPGSFNTARATHVGVGRSLGLWLGRRRALAWRLRFGGIGI